MSKLLCKFNHVSHFRRKLYVIRSKKYFKHLNEVCCELIERNETDNNITNALSMAGYDRSYLVTESVNQKLERQFWKNWNYLLRELEIPTDKTSNVIKQYKSGNSSRMWFDYFIVKINVSYQRFLKFIKLNLNFWNFESLLQHYTLKISAM